VAYADIYAAAVVTDSPLAKQVAVACAKAAADIYNEAPDTANHANRLTWSRAVMANPPAMAARMVWSVLENPTIQAAPGEAVDGDVQYVVNSLIDTFANGQ
jgi:hypothetical protein